MKNLLIDYIGESTSMGYYNGTDHVGDTDYCVPSMLQSALVAAGHNSSVINKSKDSVTVDWCLGIKDGDESHYEPSLIASPPGTIYELAKSKSSAAIISLGINDSINVNIAEFVRDFNALITNCKIAGKKPYIVLPNKINAADNDKLFAVAATMEEIGEQQNVTVIGKSLFDVPLYDQYHPTAAGYRTIANEVIKVVEADVVDIINHRTAVGFYIAVFNKGPEKAGLDYWANELLYHTVDSVAQSVVNATESYEGAMTNTAFLQRIYSNLLNRDPDSEGLHYWLNAIDSTSRGAVLNTIVNVLEEGNAPQADKDIFQNKISVGLSNGYIYGDESKIDLVGVTADFDSVWI